MNEELSPLEAALAREKRRLDTSILKPTTVHSLNDIRRVVDELNPLRQKSADSAPIYVTINEEDGSIAKLSTTTRSKTRREHLIEGMDVVKKQMAIDQSADYSIEINGHPVKPAGVGSRGGGSYWVDPILKQWLGAYRDGLLICWNLDGKVYQYDIYEHKLSVVVSEPK